jgi:hypothetical protein
LGVNLGELSNSISKRCKGNFNRHLKIHWKKKPYLTDFLPAQAKFLTKSIFPRGWTLQAAIKGGGPLYAMVEPFSTDNYAMVGGKKAQGKLTARYIKRFT